MNEIDICKTTLTWNKLNNKFNSSNYMPIGGFSYKFHFKNNVDAHLVFLL